MIADRDTVIRALTGIIGTVIALTFLFGFGNVFNLGLRLGVPVYVAPLVAPAVDLSVLGLLIGTRYLALHGASREQLRPARRLLLGASTVTLGLNVAEPVCAGQFGKAAFDAVGPLLLIGWAEVGPHLLQAVHEISEHPQQEPVRQGDEIAQQTESTPTGHEGDNLERTAEGQNDDVLAEYIDGASLFAEACRLDTEHWHKHSRPIAAETLRRELRIGARPARELVRSVRTQYVIQHAPPRKSDTTDTDLTPAP